MCAYVVKLIGNNSGRGKKHFYLYEQHRDKETGLVVSAYIRPAKSKEDKDPFKPISRKESSQSPKSKSRYRYSRCF